MRKCPWHVTKVLWGGASGADTYAKAWADAFRVEDELYEADWSNIYAPGAYVRTRNGEDYNARAGYDRNELMAQNADALVVAWNGTSKGTLDMIGRAIAHGLPIHPSRVLSVETSRGTAQAIMVNAVRSWTIVYRDDLGMKILPDKIKLVEALIKEKGWVYRWESSTALAKRAVAQVE